MNAKNIFHISVTGKASGNGTENRPFCSISAAIRKLQSLKNNAPAKLILHEGRHYIADTLQITGDRQVEICGGQGEIAEISGGHEITDWKPVTLNGKKCLQAKVDFPVEQLYWRGKPMQRAAFPKHGKLYRCKDELDDPAHYLFHKQDKFIAEDNSFNSEWHNIKGIIVCFTHLWIEEYLPVESFDKKRNVVTTSRASIFRLYKDNGEYRFENVREALLEPGEFYYDSSESTVTIIPPKGFSTSKERPVVPAVGVMMMIKDAANITIKNIRFSHGGGYFPLPDQRYYDIHGFHIRNHAVCQNTWRTGNRGKRLGASAQAATHVPGIIYFHHAENCTVEHCEITASGWYGIEIGEGCKNIVISRNELHHLGGGGIRIGGAPFGEPSQNHTSRIQVVNNHLHNLGEQFFSGVGIQIVHAFGNLIEHNYIHDLCYSAISCGWVWGFTDSITSENHIGWNRIHTIGKKILSDMGAIYLLGVQPGTRVYNNMVYDIQARYYGGWGIYTDEGSSHMIIEGNICYDCGSNAYNQHFGRENLLRYNIFIGGTAGTVKMQRGLEESSPDSPNKSIYPGCSGTCGLTVINNVIISNSDNVYSSGDLNNLKRPTFYADANIIWTIDKPRRNLSVAASDDSAQQSLTRNEWIALGQDQYSVFANPGFTNLEKHDFSFGPASLLAKRHFPAMDTTKIGIIPE